MHTARHAVVVFATLGACASTQAEIRSLPPDQRTYFDAIRTADRTASDAAALKTAKASRELTPADRDAVMAAETSLAAIAPRRIDDGTKPSLVQIELAFDGTWDDRAKMVFETNPALLIELFDGPKHYETGVGTTTMTKLVGGAAGAGVHHRIDRAYEWLVDECNRVARADPRTEIALIITGFSRGSTTARAFANVLDKRGVPDRATKGAMLATPRIAALILFDTVGSVGIPGTDLNPGLDLSIPATAENVLHLTARDEKRKMFPLSSAKDPTQPDDPRITEIALPGVHSDVGGSYPNPYSRIALRMAYDYLQRAGARLKPIGETPDIRDASLRLHRSGGDGTRTVYPSKNPRPR
jgi:uncharacterized protein (DUF2235 family)